MSASSLRSVVRSAPSIPMGRLIHDVARLRRKLLDTGMLPAGVTRAQWSVLSALASRGREPLAQSELAKALEIGKVTLGGLVDRLEAKGFVRREPDASDRRIKRLSLTGKGQRAVAALDDVRPVIDDMVMRGLSPQARSRLAESLATMRANLLQLERRDAGHAGRARLSAV